jgi:ornithine cyclodeaminase/alanine dehydrogenase
MPGRASDDDVTVYESLGVAVEDLASAQAILERARARGKGQWLEWGGPA